MEPTPDTPLPPKEKTVYSFDPVTRVYCGTAIADQSPEDPPGTYLVPAHATEVEPPPPQDGCEVRWNPEADAWDVTPIPLESAAPVPAEPELTPEQQDARREAGARALTREVLDSVAAQRGYDNILAAVSYADEPAVPAFQAEGRAFRRWRSLVWESVNATISAARASGEWPAAQEFVSGLPAFEPEPPPAA